jgi:hypothetical protein
MATGVAKVSPSVDKARIGQGRRREGGREGGSMYASTAARSALKRGRRLLTVSLFEAT